MSTARTFSGPGGRFRATVAAPGDKSMSHRALILAAMASGDSRLRGLGPGADVGSTVRCLRQFGIEITPAARPELVRSPGVQGWRDVDTALDAANSGTTVRLLAGAVAARPFTTRLTGDPSLRRRPMRRLIYPLSSLGAVVTVSRAGTLPITITGAPLVGTTVWLPEASAQVRSAFALAALQAKGISTVDSPPGFRDHTERWLQALGRGRRRGDTGFEVHPGPVPALDITVPGDPSSAAFLWTAAAMSDAEVTTPGVSLNPGRIGLLDVIATMGA
ncbi:MAG TPA: 3-phosphoshikimate 1-carboxyvinyltransferase, partial [Actinobacteria bacterium]|nr:3-phosphoshikimate 1-carboxyvinyltransferase [Actinomycetota bacterium]